MSIYISSLQRETALYFFHLLSFNMPVSKKISDLARSGINVRANTIILHLVFACMFVPFQVLFFVFTCDVDSSLPPVLSHSPRYYRKLDQKGPWADQEHFVRVSDNVSFCLFVLY